MRFRHGITLPKGICANLSEEDFTIMIAVSLSMDALWENALGTNWREKINAKKLKEIYLKI